MGNRKIYIENVACYRRSLDASKIKEYFLLNNCNFVTNPKKADYIIVVTCAVFKAREDASLKKIMKFYGKYRAKLIVAGCLPAINKTRLRSVYDGPAICTKDLNDIDRLFPDFHLGFNDIPDANTFTKVKHSSVSVKETLLAFHNNSWSNYLKLLYYISKRSTTPYNIRIAWGCLSSCSYCGIRKAIGGLKSKPLDICLTELDNGVAKGIHFFSLLADDVGAYGLDIGTDFPTLIEAMLERHPGISFIVNDVHPRWLIKYVDRLSPHFESGSIAEMWCPVQSGSDRILKLMQRYNDSASIREALVKLKNASPASLINSCLICGFLSETDDDWEQSLSLISESKIDIVWVFPYCQVKGSKAEAMSGQIDRETINNRINRAKQFLRMTNVLAVFQDMPYESKKLSRLEEGVEKFFIHASEIILNCVSFSSKFRALTAKGFRRIFSRNSG
jgi:tRNA A37 methylthiotransferase MiaB